MDAKAHWDRVFKTRTPNEMSWFESESTLSLSLIREASPDRDSAIIDVGSGSSTLVDGLLEAGYHHITALDLSGLAFAQTRERLGRRADAVTWLEADILLIALPAHAFDVWHDRAVFHFLTDQRDRDRYVMQMRHALRPGGFALVATFAEDGPARCSGLAVARYSANELHAQFGDDFRLLTSRHEMHHTPWGAEQAFTYCLCRYEPRALARHAA